MKDLHPQQIACKATALLFELWRHIMYWSPTQDSNLRRLVPKTSGQPLTQSEKYFGKSSGNRIRTGVNGLMRPVSNLYSIPHHIQPVSVFWLTGYLNYCREMYHGTSTCPEWIGFRDDRHFGNPNGPVIRWTG